jgi:hypothetical protein
VCQQVDELGESNPRDCSTIAERAQGAFCITSRGPAVQEEMYQKPCAASDSPSGASMTLQHVWGWSTVNRKDIARSLTGTDKCAMMCMHAKGCV